MSKILTDDLIPALKDKVDGGSDTLKIYATNLKVADDTPTAWLNALGGKRGYYVIVYNQDKCFASQPYQWGILEVWSASESPDVDIYMKWNDMKSGSYTCYRAGNAARWQKTWDKYILGTVDPGVAQFGSLKIQWGEETVGTLNEGGMFSRQYTFPQEFNSVPKVIVSSNKARVTCGFSSVTTSRFWLEAYSPINSSNVTLSWIAIG